MPEGEGTTTETEATTAGETSANGETSESTDAVEGAEHLGDKGKKALDEMKAKWKAAEAAAKESGSKLAELQAQADGKEAEYKAQQEAQRLKDEALGAANKRILKAEIRAAAAGKLADPADALQFIDLASFEVTEDGEVDAAAITAAVADLITKKPYLAVQDGKRFQGGGDGGARKETSKTIAEQIVDAEAAGDWTTARRLKTQQLVDINTGK